MSVSSSWWYLSRASGLVATVLAVASLVWGVLFSARETGVRRSPAWWLDLHNWLGGLALAFTALHVVASVANSDTGLRLVDTVVPGSASFDTAAMAWGVIAFELFAVVVATSWRPIKQEMGRRAWHLVHLLAIPAVALGGLHGYLSGSDASTPAFRIGLGLLAGIAVYPAVIRVSGIVVDRRGRAAITRR